LQFSIAQVVIAGVAMSGWQWSWLQFPVAIVLGGHFPR